MGVLRVHGPLSTFMRYYSSNLVVIIAAYKCYFYFQNCLILGTFCTQLDSEW